MVNIRIGFKIGKSKEVFINKPFKEIFYSDIKPHIPKGDDVMGWVWIYKRK